MGWVVDIYVGVFISEMLEEKIIGSLTPDLLETNDVRVMLGDESAQAIIGDVGGLLFSMFGLGQYVVETIDIPGNNLVATTC